MNPDTNKFEELFKESVVKHELAKARIAELEAERDGLKCCGNCGSRKKN